MKNVLMTAAILIAFTASGAQATVPNLQHDADAIHALGVSGVQARVTDSRETVVTSGVADRVTGQLMPGDGRFRIASTRKAIEATVVLQLVGEAKLSLDDSVAKWLPNTDRRITVRHLLQNTSGIHDDLPGYTSPEEYYEQRDDVYTRDQLVKRALSHPLDFTPGTRWAYSNSGFLLAGALVERVTGRTLEREITDRIVRPLGMRSTTFPGTDPTLPRPRARAYELYPGNKLVDVTEQVSVDPDSMISTTADLNRFFRGLLGGRLLKPAQLAEMKRTVRINAEVDQVWPGGRYGLGLAQRPLPCGGVYWGHDGGDGAFITVTGATADGRRSVVVSMSTALGDSLEHHLQQQRAADKLVQNALCA